jgi:hypothetical protein
MLDFRTVESDRLFYDQYHYCVLFRQNELSAIRGLQSHNIDQVIAMRNRWRNLPSSSRGSITQDVIQNLHSMCQFLSARQDRFKIVISMDYGYVYTNDLDLVREIRSIPWISTYDLKKVSVTRPRDVVVLQNPQWQQRSYFKSLRVSVDQQEKLKAFLTSRQNIKVGPGLRAWLDKINSRPWNNYTLGYFFFDHNDDGELFLFQIAFPGLIRKTVPIVAK